MPRDDVAQICDAARDAMQQEDEMPTGKRISLKLTPQQKEEIMKATGKNAEELEFTVEELEERIAPLKIWASGGVREPPRGACRAARPRRGLPGAAAAGLLRPPRAGVVP